MLLIKNPAGANEAVRTLVEGAAPRVAVIALNDAIADGRDVSWIWDVDFEPLLAGLDRLVATGEPRGRAGAALRLRRPRRASGSRSCPSLERALDRGLELTPAGGELTVLPTYTAMLALRKIVAARGHVANYWETRGVKIRVGHLYPDYLNIYADRGNIAVLRRARAARAGTSSRCGRSACATPCPPARSTSSTSAAARIASRRSSRTTSPQKADALREAVEGGAAFLAVCGGYQLLGRSYRDVAGEELPGIGLLPLHTIAGERRMIGDVLLDCAWAGQTLAGLREPRRPHDPRRRRRAARPRASPASATTASRATRAAAYRRAYGTYLHGPLLPRNPWFADRLLADALAHAGRRPTSSRRCRTSSSSRRTPSPPSARGRAAAGAELGDEDAAPSLEPRRHRWRNHVSVEPRSALLDPRQRVLTRRRARSGSPPGHRS